MSLSRRRGHKRMSSMRHRKRGADRGVSAAAPRSPIFRCKRSAVETRTQGQGAAELTSAGDPEGGGAGRRETGIAAPSCPKELRQLTLWRSVWLSYSELWTTFSISFWYDGISMISSSWSWSSEHLMSRSPGPSSALSPWSGHRFRRATRYRQQMRVTQTLR